MRSFSVIAVYVVHYGYDYLEYSIRSVHDHVDKIVLSVAKKSWNYKDVVELDDEFMDYVRDLEQRYEKVVVATIDQADTEEAQRNLTIPYASNYDYYFLLDFDEIYDGAALERLYEFVEANPGFSAYNIPFYHFWRGFGHRIDESIFKPVQRLFKVGRRFRFKWASKSGFKFKAQKVVPWEVCNCFHFSYAREPKEIEHKTRIWAHAQDVRPNWFQDVFLKWPENRDMENIHPYGGQETIWPRIVSFDKEALPDLMKEHPYYDMDIIE